MIPSSGRYWGNGEDVISGVRSATDIMCSLIAQFNTWVQTPTCVQMEKKIKVTPCKNVLEIYCKDMQYTNTQNI